MKTSKMGGGIRDFNTLILLITVLGSAFPLATAIAEEMPMKSESTDAATMEPMTSTSMQGGSAPDDARDSNAYSDGYEYRGMAGWEETDEITYSKVMADQLEYRNNEGNDTLRWDIQGWYGTDYNKFWAKLEGEDETSSNVGDLELQTLYSRSIAAFWDFQIGGRYDRTYSSTSTVDRFFAVIGFQGLAPYWFEVEPALFISEEGNVSARITSTYDVLFSQQLILQPRLEINAAASEARKYDVGKGLNDIQFGLRLRYQFRREIAPYIGIAWQTLFGDTADIARADNARTFNVSLISGIRLWF